MNSYSSSNPLVKLLTYQVYSNNQNTYQVPLWEVLLVFILIVIGFIVGVLVGMATVTCTSETFSTSYSSDAYQV